MATHLSFLILLVLSGLSASVAWNVSINCGASDVYIDSNSIEWIGDDKLIETGKIREVEHPNVPLRTLRVFTTKRNCYSINAPRDEQVLVRASFYYGNYDNQSFPPTFELQFDGNFWATVETQIEEVVRYEVIYFVKGDAISVCVAKTKEDNFPFMSTLEVRSLAPNMYQRANKNVGLISERRFAFGATTPVRYPDDIYDRIWKPKSNINNSIIIPRNKEQQITISANDYPPEAALVGGLTAPSEIMGFRFRFPDYEIPIYINMYFVEVVSNLSLNRSFFVFKDALLLTPEPIVPYYKNVTELTFSNITASSETEFALVATLYSSLPPILNALEIFSVTDSLTDGTNRRDVEGLAALKTMFNKQLQEWNGDPCFPRNYQWDFLNCSTDFSPRVTSLNLSRFGLSGPLPDFSSMDALQYIDLSNNSLNGTIPDFLATLPQLRQLNLENNNFTGIVPAPLLNGSNINLKVSGNPELCTSRNSCKYTSFSSNQRNNNLATIFAVSVSILVMFRVLC